MRISDWSSDVCSSDLAEAVVEEGPARAARQQEVAADEGQGGGDQRVGGLQHGPHYGVGAQVASRDNVLDQIAVEWDRLRRSIDRVNLIYPFWCERIHVIGRNRAAVPSDHDPLWGSRAKRALPRGYPVLSRRDDQPKRARTKN